MYKANKEKVFAVAPMMDWTDRHCRYFHRLMTKRALLYTEMVVADAVLHGNRDYLLRYNVEEHPVALQLGGSEPDKLAKAAAIAVTYGYDEINLNVGCPSDRVQSGTFGACLMREPELVGQCVSAMKEAVDIPVTVKCRIGVDEQNTQEALDNLANQVWSRGADALWVHARKAWLEGLSPKENRDIPPLDYSRVYDLKEKNESHFIGINGGVENLIQARSHLQACDGVMLGRAAYHDCSLLRTVDTDIFEQTDAPVDYHYILSKMCDYAESHLADGGRLNHITRHMMGLFSGKPGARLYRQILSVQAVKPLASPKVLVDAFSAVEFGTEELVSS
jgi:tRNA-dihydrouridine synthase A